MQEDKKSAPDKGKDKKDEIEEEDLEDLDDELFEDDEDFDEEGEDTWEKVRNWTQDNLRVILSVLIVALIAVGIYNYSRKPVEEQPGPVDEVVTEESEISIVEEEPEGELEVKEPEAKEGEVTVSEGEVKEEIKEPEQIKDETPEPKVEQQVQEETTTSGKTYKVSAGSGDGVTNLARSALKERLASSPDSGLTKEQKIYIEDYMQKNVGSGWLEVGESKEFSEDLINEAISKAKTLNEYQLNNLKKYSARVSDL